jgi:hypothetical protein
MKWSYILFGVLFIVITSLLGLVALGQNSVTTFWIAYMASAAVLSLIVFTGRHYRLAAIVVFDLVLFLIFTVQFPAFYQVDRDTGFESLYTKELVAHGRWDPALGGGYAQEYYGYNPLLHFVMGFLAVTTGLSVDVLAKFFLVLILRIVFLLLAFRVMSLFVRYTDVIFASLLIYVISPRLRILYISRRFMAALMILMALLCLLQARRSGKKMTWNVLFVVFSSLVIVADHTLSALWLAFLFGALVFHAVLALLPGQPFKRLAPGKALVAMLLRFALYAVLWLGWNLAVSPIILQGDLGYLNDLVGFFEGFSTAASDVGGIISYSFGQHGIIMISQALVALLGGLGVLLSVVKRPRFEQSDLLAYYALFSFPAFAVTLYLVQSSWVVMSNVTMWFFLIPICIFAGTFIHYVNRRMVGLLVTLPLILIVFAGGLLLQYHPNVLFNDGSEVIVELPEYKHGQLVASGGWLAQHADMNTVVADRAVFDIYSAYYGIAVTPVDITKEVYAANQTELEKRFLQRPVYYGSYRHTAQDARAGYIVVNKDLLTHPSYHFQLTLEDLRKFENSRLLRRVYENDKIIIYENVAQMAS